uniref:Reverse transcriptase domain-containing protein n=1 Tax=Amphiprion percula TaxID=161767 RepID=A0A3P8RUL5_AMPPE
MRRSHLHGRPVHPLYSLLLFSLCLTGYSTGRAPSASQGCNCITMLLMNKHNTLHWFKSYLSDRFQFVHVNNDSSEHTRVNHGVLQGSFLGLILFTLYMLPLGNIIRKHCINFHCYADNTQLYLSMKPDVTNKLARLQDCLKDIKTWMTYNFLLLNSDKTEVIVFGPKHLRELLSKHIVTLDGITLTFSTTVRNLGIIFDQDMSFNSHIKQICRTSFFHLRNTVKIRNILSQSDAEKLIHAFVTSRLDYCNSLLSGCPKSSLRHLQLIQNAAARVLTGVNKRDHISPILASLHWLPVKSRIEFKILLLTYKALNNQSPSYLKDLIVPYYPSRTLRSQTAGLLVVPRISKSRMGGRAFSYQLLSCGTSSQFGFWRRTPSLFLRPGLKPSFLTKLIVRADWGTLRG